MSDDFVIPEAVNAMWLGLARQLADAVPDIVIADDPEKAIRWATCAEACFWKATGDSDTHDVKDVLAAAPTTKTDQGAG
jgi:hypothetical protein